MNKARETNGSGLSAKLIHVSGFLDFLNPAIQNLVAPASVIVFQRNAVDQAAFDAIEYWQAMGKPVVIDLDDAYHILPWSNPAHKFWLEQSDGLPLKNLEEALRRSHGLVAPNRLLLSDWSHVAKGYYLPNFADRTFWSNLPTHAEAKQKLGLQDRTVIGWGGSVSHYDSWWGSGLREAAEQVTKRHPEVTWMICGNDPRIYHQLPVSPLNKYLQPGVEPSLWPAVVMTFDLGVAPLFGPYDQRRSWIKGLEYLLAGVPWIGTAGEPYHDLAGLGQLIYNGMEAWEMALEEALKNLPDLRTVAAERRPVAEQWFADQRTDTMRQIFTTVIQDANARGRLPGVYRV